MYRLARGELVLGALQCRVVRARIAAELKRGLRVPAPILLSRRLNSGRRDMARKKHLEVVRGDKAGFVQARAVPRLPLSKERASLCFAEQPPTMSGCCCCWCGRE